MRIHKRLTLCFVLLTASIFASEAKIQTILLWPETPPGAQEGDAEQALTTATAIRQATYEVPQGNRRNIRVPAIDVTLPAEGQGSGVAMVIFCGGAYGAVCIKSEGMPMQQFLNDHGIAVFMVSYRCSPFNHLLYDDWFVSSIAPKTAPFSSAEVRSVEQIYEAFVSGLEPLPNSAYVAAEPLSVAAASTAASDLIDDSTSWHSVASKLEVDGMFNINSTSVAAWTALLKHADGDDVPYNSVDLENNWSVKLEKSADASGSPVSRTSLAGYPKANPDSDIQKIGRHQRLSDAQVRALATEIVEQVKARGPFLSLSEFMNRRLSSDRSLARSGAVEAALNELASRGAGASENPFSGIQSYFTGTVTIPDGVTYPFEEAAEGNLAYGFPGWMRQADVLSPIAPILSARDDTFVIRAYGECKDPLTGDAKAGAWCEAVLQRRADYVDSINDEAITLPSESTLTSEINKRFGRRFVIVSFRWLAADEV